MPVGASSPNPAPSFTAWAAVTLLSGAIVAGPLALGSTGPWARFALEATMVAAAVLSLIGNRRGVATVLLPLALVAVGAVQLLPLPESALSRVAPAPAGMWKMAVAGASPRWATISIDPHATALALVRLFVGIAALVAVRDLAKNPLLKRFLTAALAASAIVILATGILLPVRGDQPRLLLGCVNIAGPIHFWLTPLKRPLETAAFGYVENVAVGVDRYAVIDWGSGDGFGPYVISNHFAGGVILTLPYLVAWVLFISRNRLPRAVAYAIASVLFAAALWTTGGLASSRAGSAALALAGAMLFALVVESRAARLVWGSVTGACSLAILAFALLLYGQWRGVADLVPPALRETVIRMLSDARFLATHIALRMFRGSPLVGTGLSTYGEAYPAYGDHGVPHYFAHNDYAQILAETGLIGAILAGVLGVVVVRRGIAFVRTARLPERILDAGPWAALTGLAGHCLFEWNLHVPANAFLACVTAGLALASAPQTAADRPVAVMRPLWRGLLTAAFLAMSVVSLAMLGRDATAARAEAALRRSLTDARLAVAGKADGLPFLELEQAVAAGERMARWDKSNPQLTVLLGQANLFLSLEPQPIDDAEQKREAARAWFRTARTNGAVCLGTPQTGMD